MSVEFVAALSMVETTNFSVKWKLTQSIIEYVCVEPSIRIRVMDNGTFAGHVVCPIV